MKRKQKHYDFEDFTDAVGSSCKGNVDVKWKDLSSSQKLNRKTTSRPYLSDIVQIIAERGKFTLKYKSFSGEEKTLDFLMRKFMKKGTILKNIENLQATQGFRKQQKETLLKVIETIIIPENRKNFWQILPLRNIEQEEEDC